MGIFRCGGEIFLSCALLAASCAPEAREEQSLALEVPASMAVGTRVQATASLVTVDLTDGSRTAEDVTPLVDWTSLSDDIVAVDQDGGLVASAEGVSIIRGRLGDLVASRRIDVGPIAVVSIELSPGDLHLQVGDAIHVRCLVTWTDGTVRDVTRSALWSSNDFDVVAVDEPGFLQARHRGTARISARVEGLDPAGTSDVVVQDWTDDLTVEASPLNTGDPQVDVDATNHAVAVWVENDGEGGRVWAAARDPLHWWRTPDEVWASPGERPSSPDVAMDDLGRAIVTWQAAGDIWLAVRPEKGEWSTPALSAGVGRAPEAVGAGEHAMVVWIGDDGARSVSLDSAGEWEEPVLALEGSFDAVHASAGTRSAIVVAHDGERFVSAWLDPTGWSAPRELVAPSDPRPAFALGLDVRGDAVMVWITGTEQAWATRAAVGGAWRQADVLDAEEGIWAETPALALDPAGTAVVALALAGDAWRELRTARYTTEGWQDVMSLGVADAAPTAPGVVCDATGAPLVVWRAMDGDAPSIFSSTLDVLGVWRSRQPIEDNNTATAGPPAIAAGHDGASVVWRAADADVGSVWAAVFE